MPSFAQAIRPLFRDEDVAAMAFVFDRRADEEVTEHAEDVDARLEAGVIAGVGRACGALLHGS